MPYKDPEQAKAAKRRYYERNKAACVARAAAHAAKDLEKANPAKVRADKERYRAENPGLWATYCGKRRAGKKQATPAWADHEKIARIYELAAVLNADGCAFGVDHVVPLKSPIVCGLHVENNLQLLPKLDNRSKGNRHWPDMP